MEVGGGTSTFFFFSGEVSNQESEAQRFFLRIKKLKQQEGGEEKGREGKERKGKEGRERGERRNALFLGVPLLRGFQAHISCLVVATVRQRQKGCFGRELQSPNFYGLLTCSALSNPLL